MVMVVGHRADKGASHTKSLTPVSSEHSLLTDGAQVLEVGIAEPASAEGSKNCRDNGFAGDSKCLVRCWKRERFLWCVRINSDLWQVSIVLEESHSYCFSPVLCILHTHTHTNKHKIHAGNIFLWTHISFQPQKACK